MYAYFGPRSASLSIQEDTKTMHYTPNEYMNLLIRNGSAGMITNEGFKNLGFSNGSNGLPKMIRYSGVTIEQYTAYLEGYALGENAK